jgi:hypothetical protein
MRLVLSWFYSSVTNRALGARLIFARKCSNKTTFVFSDIFFSVIQTISSGNTGHVKHLFSNSSPNFDTAVRPLRQNNQSVHWKFTTVM